MSYTIKNFKAFKGHEGEPCGQGTLHGPKGKVADWSDDAHGGPLNYHFVSKAAEAEFATFAKTYLADKLDFQGKPYDTAAMHPYRLVETALETLSHEFEQAKEDLKHAKKGIAYWRKDPKAPRGKSLYVWSVPYTPKNVAKLRADYPDDLLEIINERLGLPLLDDAAAEMDRYRKVCKTRTLFTLRADGGEVQVMEVKSPYTKELAARLRTRHPNLVEIINERYL